MKKKLTALVCILLCTAFALTGCHGSKGRTGFDVPASFDIGKEYDITFWAKNDTNKNQTDIYNKAINDFMELYPNIHVTMRLYTDYSRIYNDVITNIATDTTPNVCITYPDHIATYLTGDNIVAPLEDLFSDEKYGFGGSELRYDSPRRDEMIEDFLDECAFGDHYYAVPFMRSTEACYINKTYVEALGYTIPDVLTWDFVWEVSDAAAAKDEDGTYLINGQKTMIPFIYKSTDNMMIQLLEQLDAGYSTEDGEILLFNDTTEELLYNIAEHTGRGAFSTFKISSYPANFLNAGQCIFAIDSTAGATWMGAKAPLSDISDDVKVDFETVVRTVPQFDPDDPSMISQGPSICVFNKADPQEVLASWLFAQYLLTNDVQIAYSETEGYVPVTSKAQGSPEYLDYLSREGENDTTYYDIKIQAVKMLIEHTSDTFTTAVFNGSASLREAAGQLIEGVVKGVRRKQTVDDAFIQKLYSDTSSLYHLDQAGASQSSASGKTELGPLPAESVALLCTLAAVWAALGAFALRSFLKEKRMLNHRP